MWNHNGGHNLFCNKNFPAKGLYVYSHIGYVFVFYLVCRGLSNASKGPFRKWYGCLGELKSLIPKECSIMVLTATATKGTKEQILDALHLPADITMIEQSPSRENLCYIKQYLDKNDPLEKKFGSLIDELKTIGIETPRTIIYCQTRKQCSVLFRLFEVYVGKKMFHGNIEPQNRVVDMYHAGTPTAVKNHISENMANDNGHIRVLISTIAFGMGVNCKQVRRVVHFGPSKTVESYIQECGRAGRDGLPSTCVLFYNGLLSVHCDSDMKHYLKLEGCSRQWLMTHFGCKVDHTKFTFMHECCANCVQNCECGTSSCGEFWSPQLNDECDIPELSIANSTISPNKCTRIVTKKDKLLLKKRLVKLQQDILNEVQVETMVTFPNILLEFNMFHISQVLDSCHSLFTIDDVLESVEIWRHKYAVDILKIVKDIFRDSNIELPDDLEQSNLYETNFSEWNMIRYDSTLVEMLDSHDFEDLDSTMESQDYSNDGNSLNIDSHS